MATRTLFNCLGCGDPGPHPLEVISNKAVAQCGHCHVRHELRVSMPERTSSMNGYQGSELFVVGLADG